MNKPAVLAQLQAQWRENPRLRYGGMVIIAILGVQGLLMLSDRVHARRAAYAADLQMLSRLEGLRKETVWLARAKAASAQLDAVTEQIPEVAGKGMAQAESQAWLTALAAEQKLGEPRIKVEDTVEVEGYPELWQVVARLEGTLPAHAHEGFMRALSDAQPWMQVERLEVAEGDAPRVVATFRGYYRRAAEEAAAKPGQHGASQDRAASRTATAGTAR